MPASDEYRRFAQECLQMAGASEDDKIRATLIHMALVWCRLAEAHADSVEPEEAD